MLRLTTAAILSLFLFGSEGSVSTPHEYRRECVVWDNVTRMLEMEPRMELSCHKNAQCTGFDCAGNYTYQGLITVFHKFVIGTCFGVTIHPCHKPVDMQVYVECPNKMVSFRHTSLTDEMIEVKGAKFNTIAGGHADAFINVHMKNISVNGQPYLSIGLKLKIRLTLGHHLETWPDPLSVQLMRDTEIPVPQCDKSVITPPHKFGSCQVIARGDSKGDTHEIMPQVSAIGAGLGRSCVTTEMYSCRSGEKCLAQNSTGHGHCVCFNGYSHHHDSDHCTPMPTTAIPIFTLRHDSQGPKKTASKELIIVLCSCVAGIAVVGIVVLLVILRLRKQRARYAQHEQLLNNEQDDDDDPLDAAT